TEATELRMTPTGARLVILAFRIVVTSASTRTRARTNPLAGVAGSTGDPAGVPVTTTSDQASVPPEYCESWTLATTRSLRGLVGSDAAMTRLTVASLWTR